MIEKFGAAVVRLVLFVEVVVVVVCVLNGELTVKDAAAESPLGLPVAVTV